MKRYIEAVHRFLSIKEVDWNASYDSNDCDSKCLFNEFKKEKTLM